MRVLIGGAQRSGTSLLRSIIGSHSRFAFFPYDLRLWTRYWGESQERPISLRGAKELVWRIVSDEKALIADVRPSGDEVVEVLSAKYNGSWTASDVFDAFLSSYAVGRSRASWGLKTPGNEIYAKDILKKWDDAIFFHVIRDPLSVAASVKHADGGSWFYDPFRHQNQWRESAQLSRINHDIFPDRYIIVRYEDLVLNPRTVSRTICAKLGVDYEKDMELGLRQPGWSGSNSSFTKEGSSERSPRKKLPPYLRNLYLRNLWPEMHALGYSVSSSPPKADFFHRGIEVLHRQWLRGMYALIRLKRKVLTSQHSV